ncbi:MAG TPA: cell wall-binding repeat-containing protein [Solirubrobacterales bacterium]|nr:cell wall-binding repeat-containing protein [Solirubrobacterales bacterium]
MAFEERPINANLPPTAGSDPPREKATKAARAKRRRKPVPTALKAIAGLLLLAVVFLVAAILGGRGGGSESAEAPAPVSEAPGGAAEAPPSQTSDELGFPAFATANTTRVGGGDAASTAAGVALATYPSGQPSQQPAAVTLVDAGEWRTAIAASALMAAPIGAPILVSEAGGMPDATSEALSALDPQGSEATGGAQVFAIGAADSPDDRRTHRVKAGGAAGAAAIAALLEKLTGSPPKHIVVAPSATPAFAMPAAAWAARAGDPILFAGHGSLPKPTAKALKADSKTPVYVLGPSSAISSDVVREIAKLSPRVRRVSGEDPVTNAIEFARYSEGGFGWNINDPGHGFVVANSTEPLDAAAAAPLSASGTWGPLLLTDSADTLPSALHGYLLDVKPGYTTDPTRAFYNHVWVIGDQEAISVNEQAEIDELAALARIGGER